MSVIVFQSENTHHWGKDHCMADLLFICLDSIALLILNYYHFTCLFESKPVTLEVSCTVILPQL